MTLPIGPERDFEQAKQLLGEYSFDLSGYQPGELVAIWQERLGAEPSWIRAAVLEALYQGRYKAYSVEQILRVWKRRGHPIRHFTSEFERVVFGPIDPSASKYAQMTNQRPSQLMKPQTEHQLRSVDATKSTPVDEVANPHAAQDQSHAPNLLDPWLTFDEQSSPPGSDPLQDHVSDSISPTSDAQEEASVQAGFTYALASSHAFAFNQPEPIRKFVPESEASEFYQRLQSVARHSL